MKKLLILCLLLFGCATTGLEQRIDKLEQMVMISQLGETGVAKRMFGRACLQGPGCMDAIAGAADDDMCVVIDSSDIVSFYKYNSSSSYGHNSPWVIDDGTLAGTERWEMTVGSNFKNADSGASYIRFYEDYTTGQHYYQLTVPASIGGNETHIIGRWKTEVYTANANKTLDGDDSSKIFRIDMTTWTADRTFTLPEASTCLGCEYAFWVRIGHASWDVRIDPGEAADQIIGTTGAGDYVYANVADSYIHLRACGNNRWMIMNADGLPSGWTNE